LGSAECDVRLISGRDAEVMASAEAGGGRCAWCGRGGRSGPVREPGDAPGSFGEMIFQNPADVCQRYAPGSSPCLVG